MGKQITGISKQDLDKNKILSGKLFSINLVDPKVAKYTVHYAPNQSRQFQVYGHLTACTMSIIYSPVTKLPKQFTFSRYSRR